MTQYSRRKCHSALVQWRKKLKRTGKPELIRKGCSGQNVLMPLTFQLRPLIKACELLCCPGKQWGRAFVRDRWKEGESWRTGKQTKAFRQMLDACDVKILKSLNENWSWTVSSLSKLNIWTSPYFETVLQSPLGDPQWQIISQLQPHSRTPVTTNWTETHMCGHSCWNTQWNSNSPTSISLQPCLSVLFWCTRSFFLHPSIEILEGRLKGTKCFFDGGRHVCLHKYTIKSFFSYISHR